MADPLHGVTLAALLETLVDRYGFEELGRRIPIRCFLNEPSLRSSLKFLRKTPWARKKVEALYVRDQRKLDKKRRRNRQRAEQRASASMPVERDETLAFTWPTDREAPAPPLPDGYVLDDGDRAAFEAVQASIGFAVGTDTWDGLDLVPGTSVAVRHGDTPIAFACAEHRPERWVELGWVAVDPAHRGRGLGRAVTAAVVARLLAADHRRIVGSTQDARIHALRIYLGLGFRPVERSDKADRWAAALARVEPEG